MYIKYTIYQIYYFAGILVDDEGIWREDDPSLSHYNADSNDLYSHLRASDSGFGGDKKSSNATLNQVCKT